MAALVGMTIDDSAQYKQRHSRIKKLTQELAALDGQQSAPSRGSVMSQKKKRKKLRGTVEKVIKPTLPGEPEKAQIGIEKADDLYREIRIENVLTDENGDQVRLKRGAEVDVIVEADTDATTKKPD
jgi:hypothetical protein